MTHVLLAAFMLLRRSHAVDVIGEALHRWTGGAGHRKAAAAVGVPHTTARGWCRRLGANAERIRVTFTKVAFALDPMLVRIEVQATPAADALEAIGVAVRAADARFGRSLTPWSFASRVSGGRLLCNTTSPFPALV